MISRGTKPVTARKRFVMISLSAVSEAPPSEELGVETLCRGRLRYSDLKEAAPGDYGICIPMSRWLSFAGWGLLSVRFGSSCWWQREWSWAGTSESLEGTTIQHSEEWETEKQCTRRSTSKIRGWRGGFMRRIG